MKPKTIVAAVLLLFVAVSLVTLIGRQPKDASQAGTGTATATSRNVPEDRLIVYYFHGNMRCATCMTLEAYSKEAVETYFPAELNSGRIEFQVINYDESTNEHFLTDYDLSFQSLVLVQIKDGEEVGHENLEKIWDLVGDKTLYFEYVKTAVDSQIASI